MEETPQIESTTEILLDNQQLIEAVRKQVEYYFSKENLQSDAYLTSQMDAQMTVPISVVMKFAKMKALTQDESVLRQALENSTITQIVGDKIKANIKSAGRSTIILREIPSDTPLDEIKEIFNYEGCKTIGAIRSDIGDSWFVAMDSEEEAKDTLFDLRLKKRTFRGQPVKARLKTETVIRSFYPLQSVPAVPVGYTPMAFPGQIMDLRSFGYALPADGLTATDGSNEQTEGKSDADVTRKDGKDRNHKGSQSGVAGSKGGNSNSGNNRKVDSNSAGRTKGAASSSSVKKEPVIEINSANFPPLPVGEDTPVPTPGYKETYLKYSFEEIISIVKEVKEAVLPVSLNPTNHPFALTATPNLDLLKKQRTYSIDETREQLRQGRPVHREAITAGAVDYRSLMYGDDGQQIPAGTVATSHSSTTAQQATVISEQPVAAPHAKQSAKSRSNSHSDGIHGQTPKKISASSWAAMVKSSAAATSAAEVASPVKVQTVKAPAAVTKQLVTGDATKKVASGAAKGGDRKKPASKEGVARGAPPAEGAKRDRKKPVVAKEGVAKAESVVKEDSGAVEVVVSVVSEESTVDQTATVTPVAPVTAPAVVEGAAKAPAVWGGKTSFASIVKLKSDEVESPVVKAAVPVAAVDPASLKKSAGSSNRPNSSGTAPNKQAVGGRATGGVNGVRTSSSAGKEGERRPRPSPNSGTAGGVASPENSHRKTSTAGGAASSNPASTTGGANSSGVWAREVLPSLPKK